MRKMTKNNEIVLEIIDNTFQVHRELLDRTPESITVPLLELIERMKEAIEGGGKLLIFGNGGSASDSLHFSAEMVGAMSELKTSLPAISLVSDPSIMTSLSNDFGFEQVFSKQIEAVGRKRDIAVAISTSGNSENCIRAIEKAREMELVTSALLGGDGGRLGEMVEYPVIVPSDNTQRVQEMHIVIIHIVCEALKRWGG